MTDIDTIRVTESPHCHLWTTDGLTADELRSGLELVEQLEDDSHLSRRLMKCTRCGQLFFHEFYEEIDWKDGNDPQYTTYIPVDDAESASRLNRLSPFALLRHHSIRIDFPSTAGKPSQPYKS